MIKIKFFIFAVFVFKKQSSTEVGQTSQAPPLAEDFIITENFLETSSEPIRKAHLISDQTPESPTDSTR